MNQPVLAPLSVSIGSGSTTATVTEFGDDGTQTYGQTVTVPAGQTLLKNFTFGFQIPATTTFRAEVYAWDGSKATGSSLFESAPMNTASTTDQQITFDTGSLPVTAGAQYVLFVTVLKDAGSGSGGMDAWFSDTYPGGLFVFQNGGDVSAWTSTAWDSGLTYGFGDCDLAFTATFDELPTSTTTIASSVNPSVFGQSVDLNATVKGSDGLPTAGTVTFFDGATQLGTASLNGSGIATYTTTTLTVGSHSITASYAGNAGHAPSSTTTALTQVVNQASTTTSLSVSMNPAPFGTNITFTAQVKAAAPGSGIPPGSIAFYFRGSVTPVATIGVDGTGTAQYSASNFAPGNSDIYAVYTGTTNYQTSTSNDIIEDIDQDTAVVDFTAAPNPSTFHQSVTFTPSVRTGTTGVTPIGTVTFYDGSTLLGTTGDVNDGPPATFSTNALTGGTHTIKAVYNGDAYHTSGATASHTQTVNVAPSMTSIASGTNPSVFGQQVTFTATVTGAGATPSGQVTFLDGTTALGTGTLNASGQAMFQTTTALSVGTHTISASYGGDGNFDVSASTTQVSQVVIKASTTTTLTSSSNPSLDGSTITLTATVTPTTPGAGTPGNLVTFSEGLNILGTGSVGADGTATLQTNALGVGTHNLTATYAGDQSFNGSFNATTYAQVVKVDTVTVTLAAVPNPSTYGQSVKFSATVAANDASGTPGGMVTFLDGMTNIGTGMLASGVASFSTSALATGPHSITATYAGDGNHAGGSSGTLSQTVNKASTTSTITSDVNPSAFGQQVTFSVVVASTVGTPTGSVSFTDGAKSLGSVMLDSTGTATLPVTTLSVGTHAIGATYGGDKNFATSSPLGGLSQSVLESASLTTLASSSNPSLIDTAVVFTATVTASAPGAGIPSGMVAFSDGTTTLGSSMVDGTGVATFSTSALTVGAHSITAAYEGDGNFIASTSAALVQNVSASAATIVVTAAPAAPTYGTSVVVTATLTGQNGTPTGTIAFSEGTTSLGSGTLDSTGVATASIATLGAGTHTITATYSGDSTYATGTGTVSVTVSKATTSLTLTSSKNPANAGESVTFSVALTSAVPGFTGTVQLLDGTAPLDTVTLTNGEGTFATTTLTAGGHVLTAVYAGDANFVNSASTALTETIDAPVMTGTDGGTTGTDDGGTTTMKKKSGCDCNVGAQTPVEVGSNAALVVLFAGLCFALRRRRSA